jgi:hypothetical protein
MGDAAKRMDETTEPERRASSRLAADLLRFEKAFDQLERKRMGLGKIGPQDRPEEMPETDKDIGHYLTCLDEALRQLAKEFGKDIDAARVVKARSARVAEPAAEQGAKASTLRGPNAALFDATDGNAPAPTIISQIDTSAV